MESTITLVGRWVWPSMATIYSARFAVRQAFWAATICAAGLMLLIATSYHTTLQNLMYGPGALLDTAAFGAIAVGLARRSRVAALCGLGLYVFEEVYVLRDSPPLTLVFAMLFTLAFVNGVRGAFALHRPRRRTRVQTTTAA